jgi:uncharacterized protein YhhL (DUF1145 family)
MLSVVFFRSSNFNLSKNMKESLKIVSSIVVVELIFVIVLYLLFSLFNWDFITKNWATEYVLIFGVFCLICFVPSVLIYENGRLS